MEVDETSQPPSQQGRDLTKFNMAKFEKLLKRQSDKPQGTQKLIQKNLKVSHIEQVYSREHGNIIYVTPHNSDSIVYRFKISDY